MTLAYVVTLVGLIVLGVVTLIAVLKYWTVHPEHREDPTREHAD